MLGKACGASIIDFNHPPLPIGSESQIQGDEGALHLLTDLLQPGLRRCFDALGIIDVMLPILEGHHRLLAQEEGPILHRQGHPQLMGSQNLQGQEVSKDQATIELPPLQEEEVGHDPMAFGRIGGIFDEASIGPLILAGLQPVLQDQGSSAQFLSELFGDLLQPQGSHFFRGIEERGRSVVLHLGIPLGKVVGPLIVFRAGQERPLMSAQQALHVVLVNDLGQLLIVAWLDDPAPIERRLTLILGQGEGTAIILIRDHADVKTGSLGSQRLLLPKGGNLVGGRISGEDDVHELSWGHW